jgi:SAM-dependent methyltransferase
MDRPELDPREIWNRRFSHPLGHRPEHHHAPGPRAAQRFSPVVDDTYEPWLERWMPLLRTGGASSILDLGCGSGRDACYLGYHGLSVLVADFSRQALQLTRRTAHDACAHAVELDIRDGLPFRHTAFKAIVANLSLHYHRWNRTQLILTQVSRRLEPGGHLLARFNSTNDINHGANGHPEVETRCCIVDGVLKRFFNRQDFDQLFRDGWRVISLEEHIVHCYRKPKAVWELVAQREPG